MNHNRFSQYNFLSDRLLANCLYGASQDYYLTLRIMAVSTRMSSRMKLTSCALASALESLDGTTPDQAYFTTLPLRLAA